MRKTIEVLPEEVLLEVFDFYRLDAMEQSQGRPWKWHRLAHVCRTWRYVISTSPRRLGLRILCEFGAPSIGSILASWPTLPLVAKFKESRKTKHIPRNVMVALRRPERLCEIDLHVTSSMLASIVKATQKPCQALESIRITVEDPAGPSILVHSAFLGGSAPHLREIKLDGVSFSFPLMRQVFLSAKNLVELYLVNIPNDVYFSPNDFVTGLSTLVQLKQLTVDFNFPASPPPPSMTRPPPQRTTLPSLTFLFFHGASGYLEEFAARIDSPSLCQIAIKPFNDTIFEIPQISQFILRLNVLKSLTRAIVRHTMDFVCILFIPEKNGLDENCLFGTWCRGLWELSFVTRILNQLSPLLSGIHSLYIKTDEFPTGEEDVDPTRWLEFFQPFTHVTQVYVWENLVPSIVQALVADDMTAEVLPELTTLQLGSFRRIPSVAKAAERFVAARRLTGRTISLTSGDEVRHCSSYHYLYAEQRQWQQQQQQREREREWREREWRELERRELKQQELKRRELEQRVREWQDLERREMERREREWEEMERQELERREREHEWEQQRQQHRQQQPQLRPTLLPRQRQPQQPPISPLSSGSRSMSETGSVPGPLPMPNPLNEAGVPSMHQMGMRPGPMTPMSPGMEHGLQINPQQMGQTGPGQV